MSHEHYVEASDWNRFPECSCGEVWWTGKRWTPMPDRSLYMDELEGAARAVRKGVECDDE